MDFNFDNEIILVAIMVIGAIFVLKIILGFITHLVDVSATRKMVGRLCKASGDLLEKMFPTYEANE